MKKQKVIPGPILMVISILGIAAFQFYWLQQNYVREKNALKIKSNLVFRETVQRLQVAKLKLDDAVWNSKYNSTEKKGLVVHDSVDRQVNVHFKPKKEFISTVNIIRNKLTDSLKMKVDTKSGLVITMRNAFVKTDLDSVRFEKEITGPLHSGNQIINFLYGADSLQEPLRLSEIDSACTKAMKKEKLNIPFSIIQADSVNASDNPAANEINVGFVNPVTYKLQLGNTFPYLLKQIAQPIFLSILLLGITILSFVLLYKNLLRQRRLAEAKNEFISNITHELKTPIATVGVAIEALKNFNAIDNPERTKEYLDISSNELQRLSLLVDKVLKLSMFEKKEMELKYETVNLKQIVDEVVSSLKLQLEKYNAKVIVTQEGDSVIQGDRLHLLSIVFNLIDNALKYSKDEPSVRIEVKDKEGAVILTVADNGIGIAPEYQDKIFEKFFRIPHGNVHNAKGYGLGLSYAAQVIQKHNGTIEVESKAGAGTKFTITFPKTMV